jgi:hypothetical protein|tara:strand:+ start:318 stop:470 length:153 start_codon:yes stop_codon:yes gene_type:complete
MRIDYEINGIFTWQEWVSLNVFQLHSLSILRSGLVPYAPDMAAYLMGSRN